MGTDQEGHCCCDNVVPPERIAQLIDHTLLRPEATISQIETLCAEAREQGFAAVCVNPTYVALCAEKLKGTSVHVCTVIGFPLGAHQTEIKVAETAQAIRDGATELDMVINIGALKDGRDDMVRQDIQAVAEACHAHKSVCKVIIECALLTDDEKVRACELSMQAGADYVKTSTGFASSGAIPEDVALMSKTVRDANLGVKAAGGIRTYGDVRKMIAAGATRIGASAGIKIIEEARAAR